MTTTPRMTPQEYMESITPQQCASTAGGWIWYCDTHDTHGNADSQGEADYISDHHAIYMDEYADGDCDITVTRGRPNTTSTERTQK